MNNIISECDAVNNAKCRTGTAATYTMWGPDSGVPYVNTRKHLRKKNTNMTKKDGIGYRGRYCGRASSFWMPMKTGVLNVFSDVADHSGFVAGPALGQSSCQFARDDICRRCGCIFGGPLHHGRGQLVRHARHLLYRYRGILSRKTNAAKTGTHPMGDVHRLHDIILEALNRPHKSHTNRKDIDFWGSARRKS